MSAWPTCWCGGQARRAVGDGYRVCSDCGTLVSRHAGEHERYARVGDDESGFYGADYWRRHVPDNLGLPSLEARAERDLSERCAQWLARIAAAHPPPASALELGCAHGGFVHLLTEAGYRAEGLEMSPAVVAEARRRFGVTVHRGPLADAGLDRRYDIVAAMDVLEHLIDPPATLETCRAHLSPGGSLFLQTPCYRGEGAAWPMLIAEDHLFLFTEPSLRRLLETAGFTAVEVGAGRFAYDMWVEARVPGPPRVGDGSLRPVAAALAALRQEADATAEDRDAVARDRVAKHTVIARLESQLAAVEADRDAKDAVIARVEAERAAVEGDRDAKDTVIARLEGELTAVERDRSAKDAAIARLEGELAVVERDRGAKGGVMARLEDRMAEVEQDRVAKDAVIGRLESELTAVEADRGAKDAVIERLETEMAAVDEDRWAKVELLSSVLAERDALAREREHGPLPRLRIGVNLEAFRPGEIGGAERHVRQLLERSAAIDPRITWVLALAPYNADAFDDAEGDDGGPTFEKRVLTPEAFRALDARSLQAWDLDLWFCPLLTLEPEAPELPSVVVIPDLQHESLPENFAPEVLAWRREHFARTVRDATRVLTVSRFSRRDLIRRFGLEGPDTERVVAVPHGVEPRFSAADAASRAEAARAVRARHGLERPYLFYPAHGWPHKNHDILFAALARLAAAEDEDGPDLVLTGGGADPSWPERWQQQGIAERVRHLGRVDDADLPGLYAGAELMVFPSRFEGFGLPLLEAMASCCPVLTSTTTSLEEVGGDAVATTDTSSAAALADAIGALLANPARRRDLARRGRARVTRFTADRAARDTLDLLRSVARRRERAEVAVVREAPRITVVTPSFEQVAFLGRALDSVLGQGYPHLELLVIDGGSRDGSVELLESYRQRHPEVLDYVSEPDCGQAAAVNKGLERASGAVVGWLNSDDVYRPGALAAVIEAFEAATAHAWLYGRAAYIDADDAVLGPYPVRPSFTWPDLAHECFLCQPAVFWWPEPLAHPRLDTNLHMCLDYDLWIRLAKHHPPLYLDRELAASRVHGDAKTLTQRKRGYDETIGTVKRHYGYSPVSWAAGRAHFLWQPKDDPLFPGPIKLGTWLLAAVLVARYNPSRPRYVLRAFGELIREARRRRAKARPR